MCIRDRTQTTFLTYQKSQPKAIQKYNAFTCAHCGRKLSFSKDRKKLLCRYGEVNPSEPCYKAAYPAEQLRGAVLDLSRIHIDRLMGISFALRSAGKADAAGTESARTT